MKAKIKEKIQILRELCIPLSEQDLTDLHACKTEWELDRVAHRLIFRD